MSNELERERETGPWLFRVKFEPMVLVTMDSEPARRPSRQGPGGKFDNPAVKIRVSGMVQVTQIARSTGFLLERRGGLRTVVLVAVFRVRFAFVTLAFADMI